MPLTPEQKQLWLSIDNILWNEWDPLDMRDIAPRDEYETYTNQIFSLVIHNSTKESIAEKLLSIEREKMNLEGVPTRCTAIAERIKTLL